MKITNVNIPADEALGLMDIKMKKLGQVVILAGKNGSGKSRILKKIFEIFSQKPSKQDISRSAQNIDAYKGSIRYYQNKIKEYNKNPNAFPYLDLSNYKENIDNNLKYIDKEQSKLDYNFIQTDIEADKYGSVNFVPKSLNLKDPSRFTKTDLLKTEERFLKPGIDNISDAILAKIQLVQDRWFNTSHQLGQYSEYEKVKALEEYEKLKQTVKLFLGTTIGRDGNGDSTLFGTNFSQLKLSDGQSILLQLCITLYSQKKSLEDLILVLDEPENHLHPNALKLAIDRVIECVPNGQIWIATHSITLLSQFDPNSIWYVDEGSISHAGKKPEKVLNSLLGESDDISKLQDFLDLPSQFATSKYAFECLFPPEVLLTEAGDPQVNQISKAINLIANNSSLKILDFGAGKGRLIANLNELSKLNGEEFSSKVDYIAYDLFSDDKDVCIQNISNVYGNAEKRYFNLESEIFTFHDKNTFDVVVMTNVLHEVEPKEWIKIFKSGGFINKLLKQDGYLLVVEDNQIPKGEKAYTKGFLVLDTPHLKDVFKIPASEEKFIIDSERNGRLKAHLIPRQYLKNINNDNIKEALESIKCTAIEKINELRSSGSTTYEEGRLHGFYSQQLTNAVLNLENF